jgi:HSP20 family molecular chaperone IbpA
MKGAYFLRRISMNIVTTIPVRLNGPESITPLLDRMRKRITLRAYQNFVGRGSVHGHDLDDWFGAERELIIKPAASVRAEAEDIFVEMVLPEIELPNLAVHIAPSQLVIASDPDEEGLQLCQVIDLPFEVSLDGVDAEQLQNMLRITAAVRS